MSGSESSSEGEGESSLDAMRRILEGSWDAEAMGAVPSSPGVAANEAAGALMSAKDRGHRLFLVDLLLPTYDITQGSNFYDEVEATSFCVALGQVLGGKTCIVLRDSKSVKTVSRVLEAREAMLASLKEDFDDEEEEEEADYDDEDDMSIEDVNAKLLEEAPESDVDAFRKQLMAEWGDEPDEDNSGAKWAEEMSKKEETTSKRPKQSAEKKSTGLGGSEKTYRLASMFGDTTFTRGPDMFDKVIQEVAANGQPKDDEDTLIILSAASDEELVGIRSLVAKYDKTKTIILVNCKLHREPMPRELNQAECVYSLLPLIAKPKDAGNPKEVAPQQPKVVVLRRFPRDWEVFVDMGNGFEIADTVRPTAVKKSGPSMEWITSTVQRFLQSKSL